MARGALLDFQIIANLGRVVLGRHATADSLERFVFTLVPGLTERAIAHCVDDIDGLVWVVITSVETGSETKRHRVVDSGSNRET